MKEHWKCIFQRNFLKIVLFLLVWTVGTNSERDSVIRVDSTELCRHVFISHSNINIKCFIRKIYNIPRRAVSKLCGSNSAWTIRKCTPVAVREAGGPQNCWGPILTLLTPALTQCNQIQFFYREREREREYNIPFHCKSHYSATAELIHHIFNDLFIQVYTSGHPSVDIVDIFINNISR